MRTFGQMADEWLNERRADVADGHLKASTAKDYASMLRRPTDPLQRRGRGRTAHVMRAFGDVPVAAITADDVDAFARKLLAASLGPKSGLIVAAHDRPPETRGRLGRRVGVLDAQGLFS